MTSREKATPRRTRRSTRSCSAFPSLRSPRISQPISIGRSVEGVVITEVKPDSPAAQKEVKPGDVIVEVTQEKVKQPADVLARLNAVKKSGRRTVLLLLSDAKGELRFVAVPTS